MRAPNSPQDEAQQVDDCLVGPVQILDDQDTRLRAELLEYGSEDLVRMVAGAQHILGGRPELAGEIVNRAKRPRGRQRIAHSPQHRCVVGPRLQKHLDER